MLSSKHKLCVLQTFTDCYLITFIDILLDDLDVCINFSRNGVQFCTHPSIPFCEMHTV
jgi:hypothetical protein